jgi:hypothetical protein
MRIAFTWNMNKLAKKHTGVISEVASVWSIQSDIMYDLCPEQTDDGPIANPKEIRQPESYLTMTPKYFIYDRSISGIVIAALRCIGYSKNSVIMLGLLWAELEHHVCTGYSVLDKTLGLGRVAVHRQLYGPF